MAPAHQIPDDDRIQQPAQQHPVVAGVQVISGDPDELVLSSQTAEPGTTADASGFASDAPSASPDRRWREIQAMFVDDPRGSVERAADLARDTLRELNTTLKQREQSLRSAWRDGNTDTEGLRTSLQGYRALVNQIVEVTRQ